MEVLFQRSQRLVDDKKPQLGYAFIVEVLVKLTEFERDLVKKYNAADLSIINNFECFQEANFPTFAIVDIDPLDRAKRQRGRIQSLVLRDAVSGFRMQGANPHRLNEYMSKVKSSVESASQWLMSAHSFEGELSFDTLETE